MKKQLSLSLLLLASQAVAKSQLAKPSDLFRRIADEMDKVGEEMKNAKGHVSSFGESFVKEMDDLWQEAGARAGRVKKAFGSTSQRSNFFVKDEKDAVLISAQIGDITPNKDANITVTNNTFKVEMKDGGNSFEITGSIDHNLLVTQMTGYKETATKDGSVESTAVQSSVIQRAIFDQLEFEKLSADFTKADKTLTIKIPKKQNPEKEVHKVTVNIK